MPATGGSGTRLQGVRYAKWAKSPRPPRSALPTALETTARNRADRQTCRTVRRAQHARGQPQGPGLVVVVRIIPGDAGAHRIDFTQPLPLNQLVNLQHGFVLHGQARKPLFQELHKLRVEFDSNSRVLGLVFSKFARVKHAGVPARMRSPRRPEGAKPENAPHVGYSEYPPGKRTSPLRRLSL